VGELDVERHLAWAHPAGGNYIPTPLVYGDELYCLNRAILTCLDARTGVQLYKHRLGGGSEFSASPVAADGKLYLVSEEGRAHVLRAGPRYEVLAESDHGAPCLATPAISEGVLFFRTLEGVVAVGRPGPAR
jgi:outer membrane protein assembly factor BamB